MLFGALFLPLFMALLMVPQSPRHFPPVAQGTLAEAVGFEPTKGCPSLVFKFYGGCL